MWFLEKTPVTTYYAYMPSFPSTNHVIRIILLSLFGTAAISAVIAMEPFMFAFPPDRPGCDAPIPYRVEEADPRFPLDSAAFRRGAFEAESVWERGLGRDLFLYDPSAPLVIRTEFDERQKMTYEAKDLESKISAYESESKRLDGAYDTAVAKYEKESAEFRKTADDFNRKLAEYNADVKDWNASGAGTSEEYAALEKRRTKLEKEEKDLVATSKRLDRLAADANDLASRLNRNTTDINRNIGTFKERYGEPKPFVQGLYDPGIPSVTVFQFEDKDDLRLVLTHELGHALGIEEHVGSAASIMYALMGGQNLEHPALSPEDIAAYVSICPPRIFSEREAFVRYLVLTPWKDVNAWDIVGIFMKR